MIYLAAYVGLSLLIGAVLAKVAVVRYASGNRYWLWDAGLTNRWDMLIYALLGAVLWPAVGVSLTFNAVRAAVWGLLSRTNSRTLAWMNEDPIVAEQNRMKRKALKAAASSHEVTAAEEEALA